MEVLYLAHNLLDRQRVRALELELEKELGIDLKNPFYDRDRLEIRALDIGLRKPYGADSDYKKIVENDLKDIEACNGMVAIVTKNFIGGSMEIFYNSHVLKRPTYLIIEDESLYSHQWLRYHATERFRSVDEFRDWYRDKVAPTKRRVR